MTRSGALLGVFMLAASACAHVAGGGNEIVLLGESNINGESAVQQAVLILRNAQAVGCRGLSVGGYATTTGEPGAIVYGVPVMVSCPPGVRLLPNGSRAP